MARLKIKSVLCGLSYALVVISYSASASATAGGIIATSFERGLPALVSTQSAIVIDRSTGRVIGGKDPDSKRPMASITKIMTALIVVERIELGALAMDSFVTVSQAAGTMGDRGQGDRSAGSIVGDLGDCERGDSACPVTPNCPRGVFQKDQDCSVGLSPGDSISVQDLLYGLLLDSGNDAAIAFAEEIAGSEANFVGLMNERAEELGLSNTHFANSHGRDPQLVDRTNCPSPTTDKARCKHYSTARELALLARTALTHPIFAMIVATPTYRTTDWSAQDSANVDSNLDNSNQLIRTGRSNYYPAAFGVKTGTTGLAGECLVAAATGDPASSDSVIAVVLGAMRNTGDRYTDAKTVLDFGLENIRPYEAEFVAQQVPASFRLGELQNATVTMRNTGTADWAAGYQLVSLASGWLTGQVSIGRLVEPGESVTITIPLRALVPGDYTFQWRMSARFVGRFGDATPKRTVKVLSNGGSNDDCAAIDQQIAAAEARKRDWQEMLRTAPPSQKPAIVEQIRRVDGEITALESRKKRLGCV